MCAEDLALRNQLEQKLDLKGAVRCPWNLSNSKQWVSEATTDILGFCCEVLQIVPGCNLI